MSFVLLNDRIINLMAVVSVQYISPDYDDEPCRLLIVMVAGETIELQGELAFEAWGHFVKTATPLRAF